MLKNNRYIGELLLVFSGIGLLLSLLVVFATGNFLLWVAAKALYGTGVLLFLFNK